MAPRAAVSAAAGRQTAAARAGNDSKWVHVTWMPHTTLAQTSHVCLSVRSAHAEIDQVRLLLSSQCDGSYNADIDKEWKVRIGIYAIGGLPLVPLTSLTPSAAVRERRRRNEEDSTPTIPNDHTQVLRPSVARATHDCSWDRFVQIPMRWRDLPRDAYLLFEVLGRGERVVYEAAMPFFGQYGRLATGLHKLELKEPSRSLGDDAFNNRGVFPLRPRNEKTRNNYSEFDNFDDDDPVWKASCVLDQLERFEEWARQPAVAQQPPAFGQLPSVPWLDALSKRRAQEVLLANAKAAEDEVSEHSIYGRCDMV